MGLFTPLERRMEGDEDGCSEKATDRKAGAEIMRQKKEDEEVKNQRRTER